ncbi:hypothetical protein RhiirA5_428633 [Rhizophagus irregularis]|uniref:Uncharacterized protein n=1 Tax=Rhizophagus irregularis TaxID=588596 RepID=A0A2N0NZY8_9GLOM|nr:hypothetical protein RhiirA5_428633 [Rhizophagus irregularis]CAB4474524.1 unnamed protein product [Rhizophagus irregularis]CAB5201877.1 unnamed protein product [Rhizophagus irregularis]
MIRDIDPTECLSNRGQNNNISFIEDYEKEMLKQTSADVLKCSRNKTFKNSTPLGPFGVVVRYSIFKGYKR